MLKKKIRIFFIWTLISLILQFSLYSFLNEQVRKVIAPSSIAPITKSVKTIIPGKNLSNIKVSYDKNYLAYLDNGSLNVYDLKNGKLIFQKSADLQMKTKVLNYQWLPDRNILIYFLTKHDGKNNYVYQQNKKGYIDNKKFNIKKEDIVEDKFEEKNYDTGTEQGGSKIYSQTTELYTLDIEPCEEGLSPDDRKNIDIENFPPGGEIKQMVFSTFTNLIYLTVQNDNVMKLLEIDVMKNVRTINKFGENIENMAVSDRYGTLYVESKIGTQKQLYALKGLERAPLTNNSNMKIIGVVKGLVYFVQQNEDYMEILTINDEPNISKVSKLKTIWKGKISAKGLTFRIDSEGTIIAFNQNKAFLVKNNKMHELSLPDGKKFFTEDGTELILLKPDKDSTFVELKPISKL